MGLTIAGRVPRRGEIDTALTPHARRQLTDIHRELDDLRQRATMINDAFLATLIETAADEARDQLRDDLIIREAQARG